MLVWSETESVCHVATSFWCDLEEEEQRESLFKAVSDNSYCQDQQVFVLFVFVFKHPGSIHPELQMLVIYSPYFSQSD